MRIKLTDHKDGTWSLYNQTDKIVIIDRGSEKECSDLKKIIDDKRKRENQLRNGVR